MVVNSSIASRRITALSSVLLLSVLWNAAGSGILHAQQNLEFPPTYRTESNTSWKVSGVVSAAGIPLPQSKIRVYESAADLPAGYKRLHHFSETDSNLSGEFEIKVKQGVSIVALAPGFAPTSVEPPMGSGYNIELTMGRKVSGTVLFPDGTPAKDAIVTPVRISRLQTDNETKNFSEILLRKHPRSRYLTTIFPEFGNGWSTKVDSQGRFEMGFLPNDRVGLEIEMEGYLSEVVFVAAKDEDLNTSAWKPEPFVESGFTFQLKKGFSIKLEGVSNDSGQPVKIKRVTVGYTGSSVDAFWLFKKEFNRANVTFSLGPSFARYALWIEPEDEHLLGHRIELDHISSSGKTTQEVRFRKGIEVHGIVSSVNDGRPIPDAQFVCLTANQKSYNTEGDFMPMDSRSDQNGSFRLLVPNVTGVVGIVGKIDGHVSIGTMNEIWFGSGGELFKRFTHPLKKDAIESTQNFDFQLEPAPSYQLTVLTPNGQPCPDAIVNATTIQPSIDGRGKKRHETFSTDRRGTALLSHWYTHASTLDRAQRDARQTKEQGAPLRHSRAVANYSTSVEVFSPTGILQGEIRLPLPTEGDFSDQKLTVTLNEGSNLQGIITDQSGRPIPGISVTTTTARPYQNNGGQQWKTKTRGDGRFRVANVPATGRLKVTVDPVAFETKERSGEIATITEDRQIGATVVLDPIECVDMRVLLRPIPPLDLKGLNNDETILAIKSYLDDALKRAPEIPDGYLSTNEIADQVSTYRSKLFANVLIEFKNVAKRHPGGELEFKLLNSMTSFLTQLGKKAAFATGESEVRYWIYETLIKRHAKRPEAQSAIPLAIHNVVDSPSSQMFAWEAFANATNVDQSKQRALYEAAWGYLLQASTARESLNTALDNACRILKQANSMESENSKFRDAFIKRFRLFEKDSKAFIAINRKYLKDKVFGQNPNYTREIETITRRDQQLLDAINKQLETGF